MRRRDKFLDSFFKNLQRNKIRERDNQRLDTEQFFTATG